MKQRQEEKVKGWGSEKCVWCPLFRTFWQVQTLRGTGGSLPVLHWGAQWGKAVNRPASYRHGAWYEQQPAAQSTSSTGTPKKDSTEGDTLN